MEENMEPKLIHHFSLTLKFMGIVIFYLNISRIFPFLFILAITDLFILSLILAHFILCQSFLIGFPPSVLDVLLCSCHQ